MIKCAGATARHIATRGLGNGTAFSVNYLALAAVALLLGSVRAATLSAWLKGHPPRAPRGRTPNAFYASVIAHCLLGALVMVCAVEWNVNFVFAIAVWTATFFLGPVRIVGTRSDDMPARRGGD